LKTRGRAPRCAGAKDEGTSAPLRWRRDEGTSALWGEGKPLVGFYGGWGVGRHFVGWGNLEG
ncbi:MAG: hypothetical protein RR827_07950, partial [Oscillospiraceae bacterium]